MHWPIGAPQVYEQALPFNLGALSDDGLLEAVRDEGLNGSMRTGVRRARNDIDVADIRQIQAPLAEQLEASSKYEAEHQNEAQALETILSDPKKAKEILGIRVTRNGHLFVTITGTSLTVWQTKPTAIITSVTRSAHSLRTYGRNVDLLLRPDGTVLVIHTSHGFLITYSMGRDFDAPAYQLIFPEGDRRHLKRRGINHLNGYGEKEENSVLDGIGLFHKIHVRFRMVIKIDAGIKCALALDDELVIATQDPSAVQCTRWSSERAGSQTNTQLLRNTKWFHGVANLSSMVYDKPMSLFAWITSDGCAYAVQRRAEGRKDSQHGSTLFNGHIFHAPENVENHARRAAINSRFSLIAVGCKDGAVGIYNVRDYTGGITLLKQLPLPVSSLTSGGITSISYSPDGYCLFVGYERGWMTWSVYGQATGSSFGAEKSIAETTDELWLTGVRDACWMASGLEVALVCQISFRVYMLEFARSAVSGCFTPANIERGLLQTSDGLMIYQGHDTSDLTTIATDVSLWLRIQYPIQYLLEQWPIRSATVSPDGRYLAIAGQRGLAHYSISSGRWKTFEDPGLQDEFFVRGGMCWYHHVLIAAVESSSGHELRLYSREHSLDNANVLHVTKLDAAVVHLALSGEDSVLVYTQANVLDHYIITASKRAVKLVKVGQIALHGIIRSPSRVRSVCWVIPDDQLQDGDPSQDVALASVIFLIDGKLVLLQPSTNEAGDLKYDMRFIGHDVEYYVFARNHSEVEMRNPVTSPGSPELAHIRPSTEQSLRDSLWIFDGTAMKVWTDVHDLLHSAATDTGRDLPEPVSIPVDFYPLSPLLQKGILFGVECELVQRRDSFSYFRTIDRTTLFIPDMLRHHLSNYDSPAALHLSHRFRHLPYFAHALEVLLHNVLDEEVDQSPDAEHAMLPAVLSFLSTFPEYLDIVVQCTRKTEVRSWQTLFAHLPPPHDLFEASLAKGDLKTAGGYLLVLHTLAEISSDAPEVIQLLRMARREQDWELCKELARFLMALDESGATLEKALRMMDLGEAVSPSAAHGRGRVKGSHDGRVEVQAGLGISGSVKGQGGGNNNSGRPGIVRSASSSYFS